MVKNIKGKILFSGTLDVKFVRTITAINTRVENVYENITSKGAIDLTDGKEYVIDFSKNDELTEGLKSFADLDKTLYYKRDNKGLLTTDNESETVIKIVGNKAEKDDKLVDSANYDSKSGSTIITLKDEYLKTLSVGEHTLRVAFSDGGEAITKFEIKEKAPNGNTENVPDNNNVKNEDNANPKTGDNIMTNVVLFTISALAICVLAIANRKRK